MRRGGNCHRNLPVNELCRLPTDWTVLRRACDLRGNKFDVQVLGPEQLDDAAFFVRIYKHLVGFRIYLPVFQVLLLRCESGADDVIGHCSRRLIRVRTHYAFSNYSRNIHKHMRRLTVTIAVRMFTSSTEKA